MFVAGLGVGPTFAVFTIIVQNAVPVPRARRGDLEPDPLPPDRHDGRPRDRLHDLPATTCPGSCSATQIIAAGCAPAQARARRALRHGFDLDQLTVGDRRRRSWPLPDPAPGAVPAGLRRRASTPRSRSPWPTASGSASAATIAAVAAALFLREIPLRADDRCGAAPLAARPTAPRSPPTDDAPSRLLLRTGPERGRRARGRSASGRVRCRRWTTDLQPSARAHRARGGRRSVPAAAAARRAPARGDAAGDASATSTSCVARTPGRDRRRRRPLPAHGGAAVARRRSTAASSPARSTTAGSTCARGEPVQMPTTGGLDPDGRYHPTWSPAGQRARRRIRRARRPRRAGSPGSGASATTRSGSSTAGSRSRCPADAAAQPGLGRAAQVVRPGEGADDPADLLRVVGHGEQGEVGLATRSRRP